MLTNCHKITLFHLLKHTKDMSLYFLSGPKSFHPQQNLPMLQPYRMLSGWPQCHFAWAHPSWPWCPTLLESSPCGGGGNCGWGHALPRSTDSCPQSPHQGSALAQFWTHIWHVVPRDNKNNIIRYIRTTLLFWSNKQHIFVFHYTHFLSLHTELFNAQMTF